MGITTDDLVPLLEAWLPRQRWFAGKGRPGPTFGVVSDVTMSEPLRHLVVEVGFADGGPPDRYQVPLVIRTDAPYGHQGFLVGETSDRLVYDGLHDPDGSAALLAFLAEGRRSADLSAYPLTALESLPAHAVGAEQSNTSIIYGDAYILKMFRRLWPGTNPDLETSLALAEAGSPHIATPVAWLDGVVDGETTTFGLMQAYLRSGTEGWRLAQASVRDLYDEADLHADEVGGDFAGEAERLGAATAEVHLQLSQALPTEPTKPDFHRELAATLHTRLAEATAAVPALRDYSKAVGQAYDALAETPPPAVLQRIHGDFHLGQVLRVENGWVLFDFEGEPARPVSTRNRCELPLRDVAGIIRSFDYAARTMLLDHEGEPSLDYRAQEWTDRNVNAFCEGYANASGRDPRDEGAALRALVLDKCVYEVVYEARHRPSWISIPLGGLDRSTGGEARFHQP